MYWLKTTGNWSSINILRHLPSRNRFIMYPPVLEGYRVWELNTCCKIYYKRYKGKDKAANAETK